MSYKQSLALLHVVILIWGFTGILGKVLTDTMSPETLVWFRMLIGIVSIGGALFFLPKSPWPTKRQVALLLLVGLVIAIHWITFFGGIQVSNVSIALACLSSGSLFTAILEPIFFRRKMLLYEVVLGLLVIGALVLIFKFETNYQLGIILSVISAFLASLFTTINGKFVKKMDPIKVSYYEIIGGWLFICGWLAFTGGFKAEMFIMSSTQVWSLLALGTICTGFAFVAGVVVMKKLSPFTVSLSLNLEPIYSIILAFFFFNEYRHLTPEFYIGAVIILGTVVANALIKARIEKRKSASTNTALS